MRLASAALQLARAAVAAGGKQVAWHLARCLVGHARDFDAGVLPEEVVLPYAAEVETAMRPALEAAAGTALGADARSQATLPSTLGGFAVHSPAQTVQPERVDGLGDDEAVHGALASHGLGPRGLDRLLLEV